MKKTGQSYYQNFVCSDNPVQNMWNKIEKSSKTGHEKKSLISFLCDFWLLLPKFNFWKRDWALGYVFIQIWDFPNISLFPKISRFVLLVVNRICTTTAKSLLQAKNVSSNHHITDCVISENILLVDGVKSPGWNWWKSWFKEMFDQNGRKLVSSKLSKSLKCN